MLTRLFAAEMSFSPYQNYGQLPQISDVSWVSRLITLLGVEDVLELQVYKQRNTGTILNGA